MRNGNGMDNMVSAVVQLLLHKMFQTEELCPVSMCFCYRMKNMRVCFGNQVKNCKAQSSAINFFLYFGSSMHMPYQQHFLYELQTFSCTSSPLIHFKSCAVPCRMSRQFGCGDTSTLGKLSR